MFSCFTTTYITQCMYRGLSAGGRVPPGFIHRVIIITGLNNLYDCTCSRLYGDGLRGRLGVKPLLKLKLYLCSMYRNRDAMKYEVPFFGME